MTKDSGSNDKHSNIEEIDCLQAIEMLYAYLDGELKDEELAQYEHHLGHCRSCFSRSQLETALNKRIQESAKGEAPAEVQNRLRNLINKL
jgi:anti-sigma factor (TIGR02949 family)